MRAVDTNVLVRLLTRDDEKQAASADAFIEGGAWVSHLVLLEAGWVLTSVYDVTSKQLSAAIEMLLQHESLVIQDAEVVSAALRMFKQQPSLGFSDCLVLEVARKAGHVPLGTFDKQLGKVDGAHRLGCRSFRRHDLGSYTTVSLGRPLTFNGSSVVGGLRL